VTRILGRGLLDGHGLPTRRAGSICQQAPVDPVPHVPGPLWTVGDDRYAGERKPAWCRVSPSIFQVYSNSGMMASCFFNTTHLEGTRKKELKLFSNAKGIPVMEV
jgi:hypothetical protein